MRERSRFTAFQINRTLLSGSSLDLHIFVIILFHFAGLCYKQYGNSKQYNRSYNNAM